MNLIIPKTIKIGGFTWEVSFVRNDSSLRSSNRYGECSYTDRKIRIESGFNQEQSNETFLHEVIHAVDNIYNNDAMCDEQIDRLAQGLHQIFGQLGINFTQKE